MDENLGHKTILMTQYLIPVILFGMIIITPEMAKGASETANVPIENNSQELNQSPASPESKSAPCHPAGSHEKPYGSKTKVPHMEELPHIHRFHKERVRKIRQHHSKYWLVSKIILVLCHLSILLIAYLHATH
jgi:hypothetical protein